MMLSACTQLCPDNEAWSPTVNRAQATVAQVDVNPSRAAPAPFTSRHKRSAHALQPHTQHVHSHSRIQEGEMFAGALSGAQDVVPDALDLAGGERGYTRDQVDEVRMVLRLTPILILSIAYWTIYTQMASVFVLQVPPLPLHSGCVRAYDVVLFTSRLACRSRPCGRDERAVSRKRVVARCISQGCQLPERRGARPRAEPLSPSVCPVWRDHSTGVTTALWSQTE